jgi:hypothetical protein
MRFRSVEQAVEKLRVDGPNVIRQTQEAVIGSVFYVIDAPKVAKSQTLSDVVTTIRAIGSVSGLAWKSGNRLMPGTTSSLLSRQEHVVHAGRRRLPGTNEEGRRTRQVFDDLLVRREAAARARLKCERAVVSPP